MESSLKLTATENRGLLNISTTLSTVSLSPFRKPGAVQIKFIIYTVIYLLHNLHLHTFTFTCKFTFTLLHIYYILQGINNTVPIETAILKGTTAYNELI